MILTKYNLTFLNLKNKNIHIFCFINVYAKDDSAKSYNLNLRNFTVKGRQLDATLMNIVR